MTLTTLTDVWQAGERQHPDKVAVMEGERTLTYGQLGDWVRRVAAGLVSQWGVQPGDIVALLAPNCIEFVVGYFAIVQVGATVQPLDERITPEEMAAILKDADTRFLIVHGALWSKFRAARELGVMVEHLLGIDLACAGIVPFDTWGESSLASTVALSPSTVAELMYTSGTTGDPKGVQRTHANVLAAARNSLRGFGYRADDVIAIAMPLSHSSALNSQMMPLLQVSGTLILLPRFQVADVIEVIKSHHVTCMRAVPAMLRLLLANPSFTSKHLPSLRLLINSSAPIDPDTYVVLKQRFPAIEVLNSYGLTEASTCTVLPDEMATIRPDSVGLPIDGVEMCVIDDCGDVVDTGCEGEICVRGDHVFLGYRQRPEATAAVMHQDWLRTGDLGYCDQDGFYYLHGRQTEVINSGGQKFVPRDVERCIEALPEVAEAAVAGMAHRLLGEVAKAFVVLKPEHHLDAKAVIRHCTQNLASFKIPYKVEFVDTLPRNGVVTLPTKLRKAC
ncbi:class I adenylate-forming enzyme family protein [Candidatus Entotheonella palauensis]|uniref:class I adenylate-forming enzyme family protein n=1 Tax=Candidatus Entotheonella palauensis TaxID=93172 RepID=UPI000B7FD649|nr:class I adenylate-forming enzyme family protein [Candidatus Entotheonella palauensis]